MDDLVKEMDVLRTAYVFVDQPARPGYQLGVRGTKDGVLLTLERPDGLILVRSSVSTAEYLMNDCERQMDALTAVIREKFVDMEQHLAEKLA